MTEAVPHAGAEQGPREPRGGGWQQPGARLPQVAEGSEVAAAGVQWIMPPAPRTANTQQGQEPRLELVLNRFFFGDDRLFLRARTEKGVGVGFGVGVRLCVGTSSSSKSSTYF